MKDDQPFKTETFSKAFDLNFISVRTFQLIFKGILKTDHCDECVKWSFIKNRHKTHTQEMHGVLVQFSCFSDWSRLDLLYVYDTMATELDVMMFGTNEHIYLGKPSLKK